MLMKYFLVVRFFWILCLNMWFIRCIWKKYKYNNSMVLQSQLACGCMGDCVFSCWTWCCWSSCCSGTLGRRRWDVPAWRSHNPRTRPPAADRYTPEDHQSLPATQAEEDTGLHFTVIVQTRYMTGIAFKLSFWRFQKKITWNDM